MVQFNFSLFVMLVKLKLVTRSFDVMADWSAMFDYFWLVIRFVLVGAVKYIR